MDASRFAKLSIDDFEKGKDCSHTSGFLVRLSPLSLMEYAEQRLIISPHSGCYEDFRFGHSRSDLSRHHFMIACAIGGIAPSTR
jgi:hypothetical protein